MRNITDIMRHSQERLEPPSLAERPVAGYMRLHRFVYSVVDDSGAGDDSFARLALLGEGDAEVERAIRLEALSWARMRGALARNAAFSQGHDVDYYRDVIASWSIRQIESWMRQFAAELGRLSWLDDAAVLKLGVTPDLICLRCAIGEHCSLMDVSNFSSPGDSNTKTVEREQYACDQLTRHLAMFDLAEGDDYMTGYEAIALRDADNSPVIADAPYMLITLGAVRTLLAS